VRVAFDVVQAPFPFIVGVERGVLVGVWVGE
jgi:hypothetical protein